MVAGWIVLVVAAAALFLLLIVWAIWQALLLRYQEEPDAHEIHSVKTKDGWDIKLFRYKPQGETGEPVFLCHGAFANHTNFTKPRGACLVDTLLEHGFDCWLIDFRGTRSSEPALGRKRTSVQMDDYLLYDIPAALAFIRQVTGYAHVHWIGHSLGGMLLYAHLLLHGDGTVASGTTLGSPIGFEGTKIVKDHLLLKLVRSFPHLAGATMRTGARIGRFLHPHTTTFPVNWRNLHPHRTALQSERFFQSSRSSASAPAPIRSAPPAAPTHSAKSRTTRPPPPQMTQELSDWATTKTWRMNNGALDVAANLHRLGIPLFAIYGAADPFVPVEQAIAFVENIPNPHKQIMILGKEDGFGENYNHVDLAFGKDGVEEVYEPIATWLLQNSLGGRDSRDDTNREGKAFLARRITVARSSDAVPTGAADDAGTARRSAKPSPKLPAAPTTRKAPAKKKTRTKAPATARRSSAAKAKRATPKKRSAKKTTAKKAATKKTTKKKAVAKRRPVPKKKPTAKKPASRTTAAKKAASKKTTAARKKPTAKKKPATKKKAVTKKRAR